MPNFIKATIDRAKKFFSRPGEFKIVFARHFPSCKIRLLRDADFPACEQIYKLNEPLHFPPGYFPDFIDWLRNGKSLIVVIEQKGAVVACGGITSSVIHDYQYAILTFGMIHPAYQGRGLGTILLLSRLALLSQNLPASVNISTVGGSETFYCRFGFEYKSAQQTTPEYLQKNYQVRVSAEDIAKCAIALQFATIEPNFFRSKVPEHQRSSASTA